MRHRLGKMRPKGKKNHAWFRCENMAKAADSTRKNNTSSSSLTASPPSPSLLSCQSMITENKYVIVRKLNGEYARLVRVSRDHTVDIDKLRFKMNNAIGKKFGLFDVKRGELEEAARTHVEPAEFLRSVEVVSRKRPCEAGDGGEAPPAKVRQTLENKIDELKAENVPVTDLVAQLVQGNQNFEKRTEFSQEKYVAKKHKEHSDKIFVLEPNLRLLCETMFQNNSTRICGLRPDLFASVVFQANVVAGCRVLVYEECQGLLLSAMLQRLDGKGELFALHMGMNKGNFPALAAMDFKPEQLNVFHPIRLTAFAKVIHKPHCSLDFRNGSANPDDDEAMECDETDDIQATPASVQLSWTRNRLLSQSLLDSIIIASDTVSATELLRGLYSSLRPSGSVVVYTTVEDELYDVQQFLLENEALNVHIHDHMSRNMQILSGRCHPELQHVLSGGYFITATKTV